MTIEESGLYYPNKFGLITIKALEDVMGRNGLNAILNLAGLIKYIDEYPPDDLVKGFDFSELSDGQRVLIALYALIYSAKNKQLSLFLDEPDNFVALQKDSPYLRALEDADLSEEIRQKRVEYAWGKAEVIYDQPDKLKHDFDKKELHIAPKLKEHINTTKQEFIVFTPYFVPRESGVEYLKRLRDKGVKVKILTNSLASTNHSFVHAGYAKHREELLRAGVELYEINTAISKWDSAGKKVDYGKETTVLHAKAFIFDREKVFIGSFNLDPRSIDHNTEIGVVFSSETIANTMASWFDQHIEEVAFRLELEADENGYKKIVWHGKEDGEQVTYEEDPHTGFWMRFYIDILGLLPIDSQL